MLDSTSDIHVQIRELSKKHVLKYYAHRLNLVLFDVDKSFDIVNFTMELFKAIYTLQLSSTLRHDIF